MTGKESTSEAGKPTRFDRLTRTPLAILRFPRRMLEGHERSSIGERRQIEIKRAAAANLKDLHETIWGQWDSAKFAELLQQREDDDRSR